MASILHRTLATTLALTMGWQSSVSASMACDKSVWSDVALELSPEDPALSREGEVREEIQASQRAAKAVSSVRGVLASEKQSAIVIMDFLLADTKRRLTEISRFNTELDANATDSASVLASKKYVASLFENLQSAADGSSRTIFQKIWKGQALKQRKEAAAQALARIDQLPALIETLTADSVYLSKLGDEIASKVVTLSAEVEYLGQLIHTLSSPEFLQPFTPRVATAIETEMLPLLIGTSSNLTTLLTIVEGSRSSVLARLRANQSVILEAQTLVTNVLPALAANSPLIKEAADHQARVTAAHLAALARMAEAAKAAEAAKIAEAEKAEATRLQQAKLAAEKAVKDAELAELKRLENARLAAEKALKDAELAEQKRLAAEKAAADKAAKEAEVLRLAEEKKLEAALAEKTRIEQLLGKDEAVPLCVRGDICTGKTVYYEREDGTIGSAVVEGVFPDGTLSARSGQAFVRQQRNDFALLDWPTGTVAGFRPRELAYLFEPASVRGVNPLAAFPNGDLIVHSSAGNGYLRRHKAHELSPAVLIDAPHFKRVGETVTAMTGDRGKIISYNHARHLFAIWTGAKWVLAKPEEVTQ